LFGYCHDQGFAMDRAPSGFWENYKATINTPENRELRRRGFVKISCVLGIGLPLTFLLMASGQWMGWPLARVTRFAIPTGMMIGLGVGNYLAAKRTRTSP
jgi:hypothetical protein